MQIIMPTLLFIGLTNILGIQILVPLGKEKIVLISEIAGAAVDLIINILLIPDMASTGAAIGTLAAEIIVFVVQFIAIRNDYGESFKKVRYMHIVIALLLGSFASLWVKLLQVGNFLILLFSASLFFGIYVMFLLITREPLIVEIFRQIIKKIFKNNLKHL